MESAAFAATYLNKTLEKRHPAGQRQRDGFVRDVLYPGQPNWGPILAIHRRELEVRSPKVVPRGL